MNSLDSLSLLNCFSGKPAVVITPLGEYAGVLKAAGKSKHEGIGSLLLRNKADWTLVTVWVAVKKA